MINLKEIYFHTQIKKLEELNETLNNLNKRYEESLSIPSHGVLESNEISEMSLSYEDKNLNDVIFSNDQRIQNRNISIHKMIGEVNSQIVNISNQIKFQNITDPYNQIDKNLLNSVKNKKNIKLVLDTQVGFVHLLNVLNLKKKIKYKIKLEHASDFNFKFQKFASEKVKVEKIHLQKSVSVQACLSLNRTEKQINSHLNSINFTILNDKFVDFLPIIKSMENQICNQTNQMINLEKLYENRLVFLIRE